MGNIKLFQLGEKVKELESTTFGLEKELQVLIEKNMDIFFGVRFLASEYSTTHGGRIDSLGIDEDNCPVIFEYKRYSNENVINQGLFYLDWLLDHKADFTLLVMEKLGKDVADQIEWAVPRLVCVASDYTNYDGYAVKQINRNIELVRYKRFGEELLMFEGVGYSTAKQSNLTISTVSKGSTDRTIVDRIAALDQDLRLLFDTIQEYILSLGDDIQTKELKNYIAFKKIKNFICMEAYPRAKTITLYLKLNPKQEELVPSLMRDVSNIGHYGTGDLEITIRTPKDFEVLKEYIQKSYEVN